MKTKLKKSLKNKQSGVSLIEILITSLILAVGLLGVASLQVSSVSSNQEGLFHSQATAIADDLASKIRASKLVTLIPNTVNRQPIGYADYLNPYIQDPVDCDAARPTCLGQNCINTDIATFDLLEACDLADQALPDGATIRVIEGVAAAAGGAPASRLSIVVDWSSAQARTGAGEVQNVNLNCQALTGSATRNCVIVELMP